MLSFLVVVSKLTLYILRNIVSFLVYLAPVPTFYRICKKKSTEGFQAIPYAVALFSAMLYLYYAFLKDKVMILITINSVGFIMEVAYLTIYMIYATKESRLLLLFNVSSLGCIIAGTYFLAKGHIRVKIVGWICAVFSVSVFAAPLSIMRQVIRTKSVEFMPFSLSFFLTICAVVWFFYGFLIRDFFIAILPAAEAKVHDITTSTIMMELKALDQPHQENSENPSNKHELEIVVLDYGDQVPGIVLVQSKEPSMT
ncbi:hypothetical protein Pfo_006209 [Paulownia fortunei]|nr:hypothetical protein Pfo_006209 [Paulownia fortunei]